MTKTELISILRVASEVAAADESDCRAADLHDEAEDARQAGKWMVAMVRQIEEHEPPTGVRITLENTDMGKPAREDEAPSIAGLACLFPEGRKYAGKAPAGDPREGARTMSESRLSEAADLARGMVACAEAGGEFMTALVNEVRRLRHVHRNEADADCAGDPRDAW